MTASSLLTSGLRAAIRAEFPYLTDTDLDAATLLGQGWGITAFRVGNLVVRVPRDNPVVPPRPGVEAALLDAMEAMGVPHVPRNARVLRDASGAEVANAYEYIHGVPARGVALRSAARERLARDVGTFLGALHAFPPALAASLEVSQRDLWSRRYVPLIDFAREHIGPRSRAWLEELVRDFLAGGGISRAPRVLTHGDIAGVHLLLEGDGSSGALAGVIDFGDAALADPALDFAGVLNDWSPAFLERVLAYYPLEVDADARRRAAFYIAVVPVYSVHYGIEHHDPEELAAGRRKLAARARASVVRAAAGR